MNLLSINLARSIWLGPINDLNPRGISLDRILFPYLIDTYKFKKYPSLAEPLDITKGLEFRDGEFAIDEESKPIRITLTIHTDGLVVDTRSSTNHSDAFLEYSFSQFSEIFKMPPFQSVMKRRLYLSQVFVSTEKSLELLNPKLKQISKYLNQYFGKDKSFQVGSISFWPDQKDKSPAMPFTFERAINVPFSENRYYSVAPLQTDQHLELLDKLEKILS